mgnify:CR=1 FL=1
MLTVSSTAASVGARTPTLGDIRMPVAAGAPWVSA